ncbi:GAF domain-containing protein [Cyanobium sp. Cruz CV13-4-11]|uniref:MBL fold metallo-hydrolase n=1 Tax=Cyanobium sp. Cruz CV13-4-11 TaxID=2823710 RepID=UPI0020CC849F|nr:MBL fold metallo-hydrolase [Cyanobium sp. Cruz CV13-4-11]MCP9901509.1 GAF domain-containing protein [Cyanobium sp. Cruz CV11-17]MCP9920544.1 GAF domain-containing protein [Cyanobium sp. Cruz CV13-4-11]
MLVRFWGTRGSIAKPGPDTLRFGGNTSCVEVRSGAGTLLVIDCGTGAHGLGQALMQERPDGMEGSLLISHTHWDHIQGFPFFAPFFSPGHAWDVYGPSGLSGSLRSVLSGQMQHAYFPVTLDQFAASIRYHDLGVGTFRIGEVTVTTHHLNHPALTLAYRLQADGATVIYCCDHEPHAPELASGIGPLSGQDLHYAEFIEGADLVIHDAQYTALEFPAKLGWGHSSVEYAVRLCEEAGVARLVLTHHDPLRNDAAIDLILARVRADLADRGSPLEVMAASEGLVLRTTPRTPDATAGAPSAEAGAESSPGAHSGDPGGPPALVWVTDRDLEAALTTALRLEGLPFQVASGEADLKQRLERDGASLLLLEQALPVRDGPGLVRRLQESPATAMAEIPVVMLAAIQEQARYDDPLVSEWLVLPVSESFLRARIRAWSLRTPCRWQRARPPQDEERRLRRLAELGLLDTEREERFDRLTRIAAAAFDVPIALISLIDAERQWFKSCHGLATCQTSRDLAFCTHAVLQRSDLLVADTWLDERFAENPLVLGEPRIRFYAGSPLILADGTCLGTLCLIDTRPRQLSGTELSLLHDLRDLVLLEISPQP